MSAPTPKLFGPDRKYERWRWQIFGITWLAYAGFYLTRKSFSIAKIELEKPGVLGLTKEQMSLIDGGFLAAYAVGMMVWGICGDRYGTRKVVAWGMIGSVLACACGRPIVSANGTPSMPTTSIGTFRAAPDVSMSTRCGRR